jgi:hypothetical protein
MMNIKNKKTCRIDKPSVVDKKVGYLVANSVAERVYKNMKLKK